uniref:C3H1-type domain-containing protein n=1 Tax=Culex tarsalis TaxID=7177 RepID=A0A1Q3F4P8_CULTA
MFSLVAYEDSDEEDANKSEHEEQAVAKVEEKSSTTSSDDSDDAGEQKDARRIKGPELSNVQPALPSASMMLADNKKIIPGGVFSNPFREAEDAKIASLEKHVKMVDPEHKTGDQKRKVCWSYRKGRCRFGSKCSFAHDSDLILKKEIHGGNPEEAGEDAAAGTSVETTNLSRKQGINPTKKKRPGLSRELVPPKKVLKMYHREKYSGKP